MTDSLEKAVVYTQTLSDSKRALSTSQRTTLKTFPNPFQARQLIFRPFKSKFAETFKVSNKRKSILGTSVWCFRQCFWQDIYGTMWDSCLVCWWLSIDLFFVCIFPVPWETNVRTTLSVGDANTRTRDGDGPQRSDRYQSPSRQRRCGLLILHDVSRNLPAEKHTHVYNMRCQRANKMNKHRSQIQIVATPVRQPLHNAIPNR